MKSDMINEKTTDSLGLHRGCFRLVCIFWNYFFAAVLLQILKLIWCDSGSTDYAASVEIIVDCSREVLKLLWYLDQMGVPPYIFSRFGDSHISLPVRNFIYNFLLSNHTVVVPNYDPYSDSDTLVRFCKKRPPFSSKGQAPVRSPPKFLNLHSLLRCTILTEGILLAVPEYHLLEFNAVWDSNFQRLVAQGTKVLVS